MLKKGHTVQEISDEALKELVYFLEEQEMILLSDVHFEKIFYVFSILNSIPLKLAIARKLPIDELQHLFKKLAVTDQVELIVYFLEQRSNLFSILTDKEQVTLLQEMKLFSGKFSDFFNWIQNFFPKKFRCIGTKIMLEDQFLLKIQNPLIKKILKGINEGDSVKFSEYLQRLSIKICQDWDVVSSKDFMSSFLSELDLISWNMYTKEGFKKFLSTLNFFQDVGATFKEYQSVGMMVAFIKFFLALKTEKNCAKILERLPSSFIEAVIYFSKEDHLILDATLRNCSLKFFQRFSLICLNDDIESINVKIFCRALLDG